MRQALLLGRSSVVLLISAVAACSGGPELSWSSPSSSPPPGRSSSDPSQGLWPGSEPSPTEPVPRPVSSTLQPDFGATVTLDQAPPALGAARVLVSDDGGRAVASDPDRDRVAIVDLATKAVSIVTLDAGDEPGRLVADDAGRVHVVLDRGGSVATIDLASAAIVARRPVCGAPRGIARHGAELFVVCSGGEIVALPTDPAGAPQVRARIDRDLRDVVALETDLLVSRLRTAEVLRVRRSDGAVLSRAAPPKSAGREPFVGWRLASAGQNSAALVHQMASTDTIVVEAPQAYGAPPTQPCGGPVMSTVTSFTPDAASDALLVEPHDTLVHAVVPVDLARSAGNRWAVIAAGNAHTKELRQVQAFASLGTAGCREAPTGQGVASDPSGQAVAVAFTHDESLVVFTREPAAIHVRAVGNTSWQSIALGGASREDTGHAIFHSNAGTGIACVSCHPGGGDDGRVWNFSTGSRRTQSLEGTLEGTAPYHWGGDMEGIESFGGPVFGKRMGGPHLGYDRLDALRAYLTRLPAPPTSAPSDPAAAARGKTLFESTAVGCSGCHSGAQLTNNESVDVGTGASGKNELFQVPSLLGVGVRAPYLHDGRAATLLDRFGPAGGGDNHGQTSGLTSAQVKDLVNYLETL